MSGVHPKLCALCEKMFTPSAVGGEASLIYCSPRCAWSTPTKRDNDSMQREIDALNSVIEPKGTA